MPPFNSMVIADSTYHRLTNWAPRRWTHAAYLRFFFQFYLPLTYHPLAFYLSNT